MPKVEVVINNDYDIEEVDRALHYHFPNTVEVGISQIDGASLECWRHYNTIDVYYDLPLIIKEYREADNEDF